MERNFLTALVLFATTTSIYSYKRVYEEYAILPGKNGYSYAVPCRNELDARNHVNDLFANMPAIGKRSGNHALEIDDCSSTTIYDNSGYSYSLECEDY